MKSIQSYVKQWFKQQQIKKTLNSVYRSAYPIIAPFAAPESGLRVACQFLIVLKIRPNGIKGVCEPQQRDIEQGDGGIEQYIMGWMSEVRADKFSRFQGSDEP